MSNTLQKNIVVTIAVVFMGATPSALYAEYGNSPTVVQPGGNMASAKDAYNKALDKSNKAMSDFSQKKDRANYKKLMDARGRFALAEADLNNSKKLEASAKALNDAVTETGYAG